MWKIAVFVTVVAFLSGVQCREEKLKILTVATEKTDGYLRFMKSAEKYNYDVQVLGMGESWRGGDVARTTGGGQKVELVKNAVEKFKDERDLLVMFVDSYDVVFSGSPKDVIKAFHNMKAKVVFSAEGYCWPDKSLASSYPEVASNEKRYLNSGGYMGYAPELYEVLSLSKIKDDDDDQLYFTEIFLDETKRAKFSMKLDTKSEIFQNLNGALEEVKVKFKGKSSYLYNIKTGTIPIILHGNGPIKSEFNSLTNYLPDVWTPTAGCLTCYTDVLNLDDVKDEDLPKILLSVHLPIPVPFVPEFFQRIAELDYPKSRIDLFITYGNEYHHVNVSEFVEEHGQEYSSFQVINPSQVISDAISRDTALQRCVNLQCDYVFFLDGIAQLEEKETLKKLIARNKKVISPLLVRPGKLWSSFWGALSPEGFYKRSDDYADIAQYKKIGVWNVPYIAQALLMKREAVEKVIGGYSAWPDLDPDMSICKALRDKGIFMFVDNRNYYGHLVYADNFVTTHLHNDMYQIFDNQYTWEKKYIHPDYRKLLEPEHKIEQPCIDVFWMPIVSETFTRHLVEEVEHLGEWSGGKNVDPRLAGGYENVPTVDIHMNQIGWEKHWLQFLKLYVAPLATKNYQGYYSDSRAIMNFVVRYKPTEQDRLRPHHDSSTFTINIALNRVNVDYQGGGVHFTRYGCYITDLRQGWMLMHPGRLTHQHEGLPTTNGTRYIMVSFIDP